MTRSGWQRGPLLAVFIVCAFAAGAWLLALVGVLRPGDPTSMRIPLWIPIVAAVILWSRRHPPLAASRGSYTPDVDAG